MCLVTTKRGMTIIGPAPRALLLLASSSRLLVASKSELRKSRDAQRLAAQQAEQGKMLAFLGLHPGIEHMVANVTFHGGTLAGASRRLKNMTSAVACYRACEAYSRCVQFTFRHSVQKGPQCFFKAASSQAIPVEKSMGDGVVDRALVSGIIDRGVNATASSVVSRSSLTAAAPSYAPAAAKHSELAAREHTELAARKPHERLKPGSGASRRAENTTRERQQARDRRRKRIEARYESDKHLELSMPSHGDRRELLAVVSALLLVMAITYFSAFVGGKS